MCVTLVKTGHVYRQLNDHESARTCYEKCLEIVRESFGKSDILVSDLLLALGQVHGSDSIVDLALKTFEQALTLLTNHYSRDHIKVAVASWGIVMVKYEMDNYDEALKYLSDFVKIQDARKIRNADYVIALQVIGDIHQFLETSEPARSAWSAAFHAYSSSKEIVSRYPELGPMLERRITACGEEIESHQSLQAETMLQTFTADLVGQLSEEVTKKDKIGRDPVEGAFQRAIFLEEWWPSE